MYVTETGTLADIKGENCKMENTAAKKKNIVLKSTVILVIAFVILFAALRATHVILRIGYKYVTRSCTEIAANGYNINDKDISDVKYLNSVERFIVNDSSITNAGFLTDFTDLRVLTMLNSASETDHYLRTVPSLGNSPELWLVMLSAEAEDLGFIADNAALKLLYIQTKDTKIKDLSGLRNKPELEKICLINVDCDDFTPLLGLPSLTLVEIVGSDIPVYIKNELTKRDVEIKNYSTVEAQETDINS